ncbi:hypothetical protein XBKQ1_1450005 [Xenorhabdus bovienii str. kraussei Quebec]|uniref:Uncharacterized protein n=1 Tax=Xenorhabdus bovienii str. kraussei Quebec TaxID=1398203 RepID=A0A077PCF0_XENBV|nr:hypothetical protein XBKQ1_1450005 [Xenorhabdus bovienii str. kraussei Quebec]
MFIFYLNGSAISNNVLLSYYPIILLSYYPIILLSYYPIILLYLINNI